MEQADLKSQGTVLGTALGNRSMECYARKLGVVGETIDEKILQGLRLKLAYLLVEDGNDVFEIFSVQGRESKAFFSKPDAFPYLLQVDRVDPNNPDSRLKIISVLKGPAVRIVR